MRPSRNMRSAPTAPAADAGEERPKLSIAAVAERLGTLRRLLALLRPHRGRFVLATLALLAGSGLSLLYPQAARWAIERGIRGGSLDWLNYVLMVVVCLFVLHAGLVWVRHYLMSWLGERVVADLRTLVFDRILGLPTAWFHERRTGELVGRLSSDVTVIEGVVGSELSIAMRNVVMLVGGMVLLLIEDPYLTLAMLLIVPPVSVGAVAFGKIIRRMSLRVQDRLAEASGQVQESVGAIQTVQAFVREEQEAAAYKRGVEAAFDQSLSLARWRAGWFSTMSLTGYIAIATIVWLGGREVIDGNISPGDMAAFMMYTTFVASSFGGLAALYGSLQRAAGATERLFDIIDTTPDIRDPESPVDLPDHGGSVRFDHVEFAYPSRPDQTVLHDLLLDVAPGEVVALVGPSGAGKTTLTSLLFRFFDVSSGAIRFEGVDVRELRLAELRRSMAMVSQEPVLFSGSLANNIAFGRPGASREEIEAAARDAHADAFIQDFPDGYETTVGERGVKLSGGQKQRVAIARALLANPRVLVLDEATSNLDAESEALVQEALTRLMKGRTTLIVAHRLSTVRDADRIVVLEEGRIVEEGTHDALMARAGSYRRLVDHQIIVGDPPAEGAAVTPLERRTA